MRDIFRSTKIDFVKNLRTYLICVGAIILAGIIALCIFGVDLDINFKGGSRYSYGFTGQVDDGSIVSAVKTATGSSSVNVSESTDISSDSKRLVISLTKDDIDGDNGEKILEELKKLYPDAGFELEESITVGATIAGSFFAKSIFAVLLAALLVVVYIGIRFRNIGGVSAGVMSFAALAVDVILAFFSCVFFRLQIDSNFMAVVLTIFGYSLNDTIVIYDRVRESRKMFPDKSIRESVNESINQSFGRTIATSVTTFLAVMTVLVVAEFFGLTTLRSFALPMAVGIVSGCFSSLCLSGPIWVLWCEAHPKKRR